MRELQVVPPEWRAWLAKTRKDPPTAEEMARCACCLCVWPAVRLRPHWHLVAPSSIKAGCCPSHDSSSTCSTSHRVLSLAAPGCIQQSMQQGDANPSGCTVEYCLQILPGALLGSSGAQQLIHCFPGVLSKQVFVSRSPVQAVVEADSQIQAVPTFTPTHPHPQTLWCCRAAERAAVMRQRVAAIEEREQQRRIRMESLGQQASTAAGPDMGAFMSQLENKGYAGSRQQQAPQDSQGQSKQDAKS